ncbi:circularly permuted type 2 ATP-grasp protein [Hyphomicrobiales bacterium FT118]|uniref:Circularly permuted type 2 ATP-grasp protein n=2 Tax=Futiania mangrovi TaxID=2959716 RepID=A0A9J6PCR0_9PROT|nr:circularly permuted type 2 ATP-grasp protein [Futiania mangrovii]MCP1336353.1 circularly permuted type 2 ATP-grasp protein [Futiania mangrovii]
MGGWGDACRPQYEMVRRWLEAMPPDVVRLKRAEAEHLFRRIGITFAVYTEGGDPERLIPFDIIPRVLDASEWALLQRGLEQRVKALNAFLHDVYHDREIVRAGHVPEALVYGNPSFLPVMKGLEVPRRVYTHIAGIDMVRTGADEFYVLEDNCRTPSGVSYMIENREVMMRLFPELFARNLIEPVSHYPEQLLETLRTVAPRNCDHEPTVALLTPGSYNSAYYEHSFLADEMGVELVEGPDLFVEGDIVYMRTTSGPKRVDVIYRRIDDDYLDPRVFKPESVLGVPGLVDAYAKGNVTVANAVGAGIADDKAVYMYVPEMVRFYLGEEPILKNVPTWNCAKPDELSHVLDNLDQLVVKMVHGSGGYGMLVGPTASKAEREAFAAQLKARPHDYIAQPTLALSTCPTFVDSGVAPRHVDLRPFVLVGEEVNIVPGGLTRVALREGSLVVNSSQGGGTKDTWVLSPRSLSAGEGA